MGENNKPFACSAHGCGMTFTNEDHLTVHKKKHDMSLNLGGGQKTNVFVADQTPTPTRFIRNCEEVGLFQDLQNVNPFEEQFRKAAEAVSSGAAMAIRELEPLAGMQPDDMLHTPHVFPLIENVPCRSSAPGNGQSKDGTKENGERLPSTSQDDKSTSDKVLSVDLDDTDDVIVLDHLKKPPEVDGKLLGNLQTKEISVESKDSSSNDLKKEAVVNVLLRMPDGRLVQLSGLSVDSPPPPDTAVGPIPVSAQWPSTVSSSSDIPPTPVNHLPVPTPKPSSEPQNGKPQGLSLAKLKLKEVLLQSSSNSKAATKKVDHTTVWSEQRVPLNPMQKIAPIAMALPNAEQLKVKATKAPSCNSREKSELPTSNQGKKRAKSPVALDGTEKRLRFLERNRAAASRCRERRKNWIKSLQRKSVSLETSNVSLQAEVASLRAEVAQLRSMLLAHKDCPVTLMMQNQQQQKQLLEPGQKPAEPSTLAGTLKPIQKKAGNIICRNTPKLSIPRKPADLKRNALSGGAIAGSVLVVSSPQTVGSQQRQTIERQLPLPSIAQTAMGTVLLPSTPESASIGTLRELQPSRIPLPDPNSSDKTVALVVTNPSVLHAVKISTLSPVPLKLVCNTQQLTDTLSVPGSKEECSSVPTALAVQEDSGKLSYKIDDKASDSA
ncbi:cyclic AMP-dependent transcription factor ATF-7 [Ischnura elegans]|uniref:cyclic AMP-dependent transcription factor ATF-7 n=1 Tax=Ischnura elegans TaxID=197161 RepID=UPI001ED8A7AD|nr:cyclic AMP-dependent transcription factor ATF-7 [Ischnura elegans]